MKRLKKMPKLILLSALSAIAFGGIAAGSTYALFTSSAQTKTTVTAGKVDVSATLTELTTYSGKDLTGNVNEDEANISQTSDNTFNAGGSASISGNTLTLSEIVPGDKVTFKIKLINKSNVKIKYRTVITCEDDNGLLSGLTFKINDTTFDGLTNKSKWSELSSTGEIKTLNGEVNLPSSVGDTYQGKTCTISYKIEAVQANAKTSDPDDSVIEIDNAAQLGCFRDIVNKMTSNEQGTTFGEKTIELTNDIDLNNKEWTPINWNGRVHKKILTFNGNNKTISKFVVNGTSNVGLFSTADYVTFEYLNLNQATINGRNRVGAFVGQAYGTTFRYCKVSNSIITASTWWDPTKNEGKGDWEDGDKAGALAGQLNEGGHSVTNCTSYNNIITGYRDVGGLVGWFGGGSGDNSIKNSTVTGCTIINDQTHNYQKYTEDTQYDVNELVGEKNNNVIEDNNAYTSNAISKITE